MAKKKTQGKKHKFKYAEASPGVQVETAMREQSPAMREQPPALGSIQTGRLRGATGVVTRDFSYVFSDLKRIVVMAVGLVAFEVVLWLLLTHTQLGDIVYRLMQV